MQLIKSSVFDKETQIRSKAIDQTRRQKALQRDRRERHKIEKHLEGLGVNPRRSSTMLSAATNLAFYEIAINGLRFRVMDGGSKLVRIRGITTQYIYTITDRHALKLSRYIRHCHVYS